MDGIFSECHRQVQDRYDSRALADRTAQAIVHSAFTAEDISFISERDCFFLSTVDPNGHPTVSYKGGAPGFVRVEDGALIFPCYDGNGMFLSMGNIKANPKVGLLFIDFVRPRRLRVQGTARLDESSERPAGAMFLIRVEPTEIFVNCPRYVHKYVRIETSKYIPDSAGSAPIAQWKRLEVVHDVLSPHDQLVAKDAGFISFEDYQAKVDAGEG